MKRNSLRLYFVAIVPEEPVYSEVLAFKTEFRDRFNSSAALRSPPHITLHMPFKWQEKKEEQLHGSLNELTILHQPFKVTLKDFGVFSPRVIYVHVEENQHLNMLQKEVGREASKIWHIYSKPNSRPFKPHITIAFRDLKKLMFTEAWQDFEQRKYKAKFTVSELCLLKHNGKSWDISHKFAFNK